MSVSTDSDSEASTSSRSPSEEIGVDKNWKKFNFQEKVQYLINPKSTGYCTFLVGNEGTEKAFRCNKWILTCVSPVFERDFNGFFTESKTIRLTDTDPLAFEYFLDFILYGQIQRIQFYPIATILELITLSDCYDIENLLDKCIKCANDKIPKLQINDLIAVWIYAKKNHSHKLIKAATDNMKKNGSLIISSPHIYDLEIIFFLELLTLLDGIVSEIDRFNILETYSKINDIESVSKDFKENSATNDQQKNKEQKLSDGQVKAEEGDKQSDIKFLDIALKLINFEKMSAQDFINGPGQSKWLDFKQKYNLIVAITLQMHNTIDPPPKVFSGLRTCQYCRRNAPCQYCSK